MTLSHHFCSILVLITCIVCFLNEFLIFSVVTISLLLIVFIIMNKKTAALLLLISLTLSIRFQYEFNYRTHVLEQFSNSQTTEFIGEVTFYDKKKIVLKLQNGFSLLVYLNHYSDSNINIHDVIRVKGTFLPYVYPTNPGQINDVNYAIYHKRLGKLFLKELTIQDKCTSFTLKKLSIYIKKCIVSQHQNHLDSLFSAMLTALIFGDSYVDLDNELKQLFQDIGLLHALVVSGSQVSLVLSLVITALTYSQIYRKLQVLFIIPICIIFYLITGGGVSVLRAIIMAIMFLFVRYFLNYQTSPFNILSFTALIIIVIDPFSMFKLGVILSFASSFSLLYGPELLKRYYPSFIPNFMQSIISCSIMPWLISTPILMIYFHQFQILSLFSNLVLIYFIELLK